MKWFTLTYLPYYSSETTTTNEFWKCRNYRGTKPLDVTCTTTGSRPKATLQWTIGQKDVTSDATERSIHITASDIHTVTSDLTYSVGKSDNGHVILYIHVQSNALTSSEIILHSFVTNTVFNLHVTFKVIEVCTPLETATLTALHVNICPLSLFPTLYVKSDITVYVSLVDMISEVARLFFWVLYKKSLRIAKR
jgi:hypothetical protein